MSLRNIVLGTFTGLAIAGLTACGSARESNIAESIISVPVANVKYSAKKPCEVSVDERNIAHVAEPTEGHFCVLDYQVEIPAIRGFEALKNIHKGMNTADILKYVDVNENQILEITEVYSALNSARLTSKR